MTDEAAAEIEEDQVLVEFDLDEAEFLRLRQELAEMFAGVGVFRAQEAEPGAASDPAGT